MKLIVLMCLAEDRDCVRRFLEEHDVPVYSELDVRGHRPGRSAGWYGESAPYSSEMLIAAVPDEKAREVMGAVWSCRDDQESRHPIHAFLLDIVETADSSERPGGATAG